MKKILFFAMLVLVLTACKEDQWMDWKTQNELWLEQNLLNDPDIKMTADSLQYKIVTIGNKTDVRPQTGSTVVCDYKGRLINGYQFDASNNASFQLVKNAVIDGWVEGLQKIYNHGDIILYIPWQLGYGSEGSGTEGNSGFIPPYSTLIFEIHLCSVQ